jgi:hypothetical protein
MLSKIHDGEVDKTHIYDSFFYELVFLVKIIGLLIFLVGIILSFRKFRKNNKFTTYLIKFGIFGIFIFLAVPIFIYTTKWISKHTRNTTALIGVEIIKTI